jgi:peptide-methionine (S)-S-oxide reductase
VAFEGYQGASFQLDTRVWNFYDWSVAHCVLRGDNAPIKLS